MKQIDSRLLNLADLPTLPGVMARILDATSDSDASADQLASLIESDHVISARVLRLANSAFFSLRRSVDSVKRAIVVVGFDAVQNLALATSVFDGLAAKRPGPLDPRAFWMHSLATGTAAKLAMERVLPAAAASCFTAGLLHDIGKYVMAVQLGDSYRAVIERSRAEGTQLRDTELEMLGANHTTVGRWVARKWNFPDLLVDTISHFYEPDSYAGPYQRQLAAVSLGDFLANEIDSTDPSVEQPSPLATSTLQLLGLDLQSIDGLRDRVRESVEHSLAFFEVFTNSR